MARTGYLITVYQDINPSSSTYNQTREERTQDSENCPNSGEANWVEYTRYCEMNDRGMNSGYEIIVYMDVEPLSDTYNQTREEKVQNLIDCELDVATPNWQDIGEPYCRQMVYMPGGLMGNDGYMIQQQQDMNEYSETADQIRDIETLDLEHCPLPDTQPNYEIIHENCHIVLYNGVLVFDGTKDVVRIDRNQYSPSWNDNVPECVNVPDPINCPTDIQVQYRWITVSGEYVCVGVDKYTLEKKQQSTDGGTTWSDVIPTQTQTGSLIEANSEDCGYVPPSTQYRWVTVSGEYVCVGYDKYSKQKKQQSTDGGETWSDVTPLETKAGELVETNSTDCGYTPPAIIYRWVTVSGEHICVGYDKYTLEKRQQSTDGGTTWSDVSPLETQAGSLIEVNSIDCGYVPPAPTQYRWVTVSGSYECVGYDKYSVEKKQQSLDGGVTWTDVSPTETRTGEVVEPLSEDCGYVPSKMCVITSLKNGEFTLTSPYTTYEATTDTLTVVATGEVTRTTYEGGYWIYGVMTPKNSDLTVRYIGNQSPGEIATEYSVEQVVSALYYDTVTIGFEISGLSNLTQGDTLNIRWGCYDGQTSYPHTGHKCEVYSTITIGNIPTPQYRWVTVSGQYECVGVNKHSVEKKQKSLDGGTTWTDVIPLETQVGPVIEYNSEDCGYIPHETQYLTFEALEDGTFHYSGGDIQYSLDDGSTWTTLIQGNESPTVTTGNKILWKKISTNSVYFGSTGRYIVYGNIMSICLGDDFENVAEYNDNYSFSRLFYQNHDLVSAENLIIPLTTLLADGCCNEMFAGCTSLTTAPALPATTLSQNCYYEMFNGCTSLVNAPALPALTMTLRCYYEMFNGCTSLVNAPALPATTLAGGCYSYMFQDCTSLVNAPALPALTMTKNCYDNMFAGCTSLTTAPALPATTLNEHCYDHMFAGCTSLTTAPELNVLNLTYYCYQYMFSGCTNLSYVKCLATNRSATGCTNNWLYNVAASGTFVKNATTWVRGSSGIPSGWTIQNQ